jgi:rhamnogalacturonan endolyase
VLGEFRKAEVTVKAGGALDLGTLTWKPVRYGKQVWEIGIPNRSAEEFRHGDHYWQWGLYLDYPKEFPQDVNFVVGKSDWRKDWNYCQPPKIQGKQVQSTTWTITFDLTEPPKAKATLRLGIAGSRLPRGIEVLANGKLAGSTGPLPDTGVMHRDGIRGYWCERSVNFEGTLLKKGSNTVQFHVPSKDWTQGVLYDYLRLEVE